MAQSGIPGGGVFGGVVTSQTRVERFRLLLFFLVCMKEKQEKLFSSAQSQ